MKARRLIILAAVGIVAVGLAVAIIIGTGNGSRVPERDLRDAVAFSQDQYRLYYLGTTYDAEPLTEILRSADAHRLTGRIFVYGECEPGPEGGALFIDSGCEPPYQVENTHICAKKPRVTRNPSAGQRTRIRGVPAFQYTEGDLDIYTGQTTVGIGVGAQGPRSELAVRRAARQLRSVDGKIGLNDPLPQPSKRALEGKLKCPRTG